MDGTSRGPTGIRFWMRVVGGRWQVVGKKDEARGLAIYFESDDEQSAIKVFIRISKLQHVESLRVEY